MFPIEEVLRVVAYNAPSRLLEHLYYQDICRCISLSALTVSRFLFLPSTTLSYRIWNLLFTLFSTFRSLSSFRSFPGRLLHSMRSVEYLLHVHFLICFLHIHYGMWSRRSRRPSNTLIVLSKNVYEDHKISNFTKIIGKNCSICANFRPKRRFSRNVLAVSLPLAESPIFENSTCVIYMCMCWCSLVCWNVFDRSENV